MRASELATRLAVTPAGAALDRYCVRYLDESLLSWVFAKSEGVAYNRPMLLSTVGRKSGLRRTVVLPYFDAGAGRLAIVGSRGGAPTDPHWALNLRAEPHAHIHLRRRQQSVLTHVASGEERASLWKSITDGAPVYLTYEERARAHREIPIFVLEREDGVPFEVHRSRDTP